MEYRFENIRGVEIFFPGLRKEKHICPRRTTELNCSNWLDLRPNGLYMVVASEGNSALNVHGSILALDPLHRTSYLSRKRGFSALV